jgi:hypothetical protein
LGFAPAMRGRVPNREVAGLFVDLAHRHQTNASCDAQNRPGAIRSIGSKLSLQRGAKFREGMGNGLRLRITQNDGHKPKKRKKITL